MKNHVERRNHISVSSTGGTFVPFDVSITTTTTNEIKAAEEVRADISRLEAELKDMEPKYNEKWQFLESIMQELHKNDASFNETSTEMVKMVSELKSRKDFDTSSITSKHNCSPCVSEAEFHEVRENVWLNSQRSH
ncbi:hypothetical protein TELCIR_16098 [Teladorsagia circumcincta]|uniref:Uncharacterized protein n=1 Tax=Teladorsagia circumcincta TaxID=45464 RepID=A0A2G9TYP8_TELCI|nr:hypothetical protein TELCIR_16098 [Teladorsagia circumcincta]